MAQQRRQLRDRVDPSAEDDAERFCLEVVVRVRFAQIQSREQVGGAPVGARGQTRSRQVVITSEVAFVMWSRRLSRLALELV